MDKSRRQCNQKIHAFKRVLDFLLHNKILVASLFFTVFAHFSDHLPADAIKPSSGDNANAKETVERKSSNPRSNVIKEFITTEEGYLRDLDVIVQHILKPLGERHEV